MTDDVDDVLEELPDRSLTMDEGSAVARALDATCYAPVGWPTDADQEGDGDDVNEMAEVMLSIYWWDGDPIGFAALLESPDHPHDEWSLEPLGRMTYEQLRTFIADALEDLGLPYEPQDAVTWTDSDGNERRRWLRDAE